MDTANTVSNSGEKEVNKRLLINAVKLEDKLINNYDELINRASLNNIKDILIGLAERERKDKRAMQSIIRKGGSVAHLLREDKATDLQMFDHQLSEDVNSIDAVDTNSVLAVVRYSLKEISGLVSIFDLIREEYDEGTKELFTMLYNSKLKTKKKLENFLDSIYYNNR